MLKPLEGEIFIVDKPLGWSSFHVVKKLRGALTTRLRRAGIKKLKVGHAGTLDPLATGLMIICSGKATKRIDELQAGVKEYIAVLKLGATTPSFDRETPEDATYPTSHITRELLDEVLKNFIGSISQVPPVYSACKVDGDRAYKLVRKGEDVELKPKKLVIDEIEVLDFSPVEIRLRIVCSKGTYIRALARDIGAALGSGAYLTDLRRTRVGNHRIENSLSVEDAARLIMEDNMTFETPEGETVVVEQLNYNDPGRRKEEADIKPFDER